MEAFVWPKGTQAELRVYDANHPQRIPTELYFADDVRKCIAGVRACDPNELCNLWLLVGSLEELSNRRLPHGFNTWLWAMESVLGADGCREIGKRVCLEQGFTLAEGRYLQAQHPYDGMEITVYPQQGKWYAIKSRPQSEMGISLKGQIVSVVEISSKSGTVSVFTADMLTSRGAVAIRLPITDLTYRRP